MDNTITIHNIDQYTQQIINGHLVLTRIFPNQSTPPASSHNEDDSDDSDDSDDPPIKRDIEFKSVGQEYAQIKHSTDGNNMFWCYCYDGILRNGQNKLDDILRPGDIVLCTFSSWGRWTGLQDGVTDHFSKMYIVHKYTDDEVRSLMSYGELPDSVIINETD